MTDPGSQARQDDESLSQLIPRVRRARGHRLYDERGNRYLDLYLAGGRALLGHRPERAFMELKNLISRGLLADLPTVFEHRLAKALALVLPDHPGIRVFANEERLVSAFGRRSSSPPGIFDPVLAGTTGSVRTAAGDIFMWRWRPFAPADPSPPDLPSVAVPRLPFPGSFVPAVACIRGIPEADLPSSDLVAPALLGALVRSVYDLVRFVGLSGSARAGGGRYCEETWARFEAPWWTRLGPYLVARCNKTAYSEVFRRLLEGGILISPEFPGPSIVPVEYTRGEIEPLRAAAAQWGHT